MMAKRALILGCTGQDGSYLAELLLGKGYEVHGVYRRTSTPSTRRIAHLLDRITLHRGDLGDPLSIDRVLNGVIPSEVYNLADQDDVGWSHETPGYSADITAGAVGRLLESVYRMNQRWAGCHARVFQPASATMFGGAPSPQNEGTPLDPMSPYACAKAHAYHLARFYRKYHGLHVSTGILFNHDSPRRGPGYLLQKLCRAAVRIKAGKQGSVALGSTNQLVDIGYAWDYVEAMWLMLQKDQPDDYVIGTGSGWTIGELWTLACRHACLDADPVSLVTADPAYPGNSVGMPTLIADTTKALEYLGWKPKTKMADLIGMIVGRWEKEEGTNA